MPPRLGSHGMRSCSLLTLLMALVWIFADEPPAHAAAPDEQRALFQRAGEKYSRGAYAEALVDFERALAIERHPSILFNIAQCHRQLGHHERARYFYRLYLAEWEGKQTTAPHLSEVLGHIRELTALIERAQRSPANSRAADEEKRPGQLSFQGLPDGAVVWIDEQQRGRTPLSSPLELAAGAHAVRIELEGFQPWRRRIEIGAGERRRERTTLVPVAPRTRAWLYAGIGATLAASGLLALGVIQNVRANDTDDLGVYEARRDISIVGYVGSALLAVGAAASFWLHWRKPRSTPSASATVAPIRRGALVLLSREL